MEISKNMCGWELQKARYLLTVAGGLGMDVSGYGELAVNPNSGNTYIWLEDEPFTLYMPINCELSTNDVWLAWDCPNCGHEEETELGDKNHRDCLDWVESLRDENGECLENCAKAVTK